MNEYELRLFPNDNSNVIQLNENDENIIKQPINNDENQILISEEEKKIKEKNKLADILLSLNKDLTKDENQTIIDVYKDYYNADEITMRELKNGLNDCLLCFMFYFIIPIFSMIYLIGVFEIKSIMNAILVVMKNSMANYFNKNLFSKDVNLNFNEDYNFYNILLTNSINISPDFNLIMIMDFLGCILLKAKGFKISAFIFLLVNSISIFFIYFFDFNDYNDDNVYSLNKLLYLLLFFISLFVGVGSSALLSQYILIDSFLKLKYHLQEKHKNKNDLLHNEEKNERRESIKKNMGDKNFSDILKSSEKKKFDYFFMICVTTFIAYFIKYFLSLFIYNKKMNFDEIETEKYNKSLIDNVTMIENIYNHDKGLFYPYIIIIYLSAIILSIILYWIFTCIFKQNKKQEEKESYRVCNICGYTIYCQDIKIDKDIPCCECIRLFCKSYRDCMEKFFVDKTKHPNDHCEICCCKYDSVDFEKNDECFCYCYKEKRKCKWFSDYISSEVQKKMISKFFGYAFLQLSSIFNLKKFKDNNKENNYYEDYNELRKMFIISISSFVVYLFFSLFFGRHFHNQMNKDNNKTNVKKVSNEVKNGMVGIILLNGIYSFIITVLYLKDYNYLFEDNYYIYPTILMNKFFYFTLIYYSLSISEDNKGFELISGSTLTSVYLLIWNTLIDLLTTNNYDYVLIFVQISISGILCMVTFCSVCCVGCVLLASMKKFKEFFGIRNDNYFLCCYILLFSHCMYLEDTHDFCGFLCNNERQCFWKCCCLKCKCCKNCIDAPLYDEDNNDIEISNVNLADYDLDAIINNEQQVSSEEL